MTSPDGYPIQLYTLGNGHRVLIEQRPTDFISLRTFINAGSINEDSLDNSSYYPRTGHIPGLAHLDEHCHFLTTQNFPKPNSWADQVEKSGANWNASTSSEIIQHELHFNREDLPYMLSMHAESVLRPIYDAQASQQEKKNVINEMGLRMNRPEYKIMSKLAHLLYDRSESQTIGRVNDIWNATPQQLKRFYQETYTPNNMLTVISGRVDPTLVLYMINRDFGAVPPSSRPPNQAAVKPVLRPGQAKVASVYDPQLTYSWVALGFPAPPRTSYRERMAMLFIADMLGGSPMSLLQQSLVEQQRVATTVSASQETSRATGMFRILAHTDPGREQQVAQAALDLVAQLNRYQPTPQLLAQTRDRIMHGFKSSIRYVDQATMMMGEEALQDGLPFFTNFMQLAQSITPTDILLTARKYLNPHTYAVVYGMPGKQPPQSAVIRGEGPSV